MTDPILNPRSKLYLPAVNAAADANAIPREIFQSLIQQESSYDPNARGGNGVGLAQLDSAAARAFSRNIYDPIENLKGGAAYLKSLFDGPAYGNRRDALSLYNSGRKADASGAGANYASEVLGRAGQLGLDLTQPQGSFFDDPLGNTGKILGDVYNGAGNAIAGAANSLNPSSWIDSFIAAFQEHLIGFLVVMGGGLVILFASWQLLSPQSA